MCTREHMCVGAANARTAACVEFPILCLTSWFVVFVFCRVFLDATYMMLVVMKMQQRMVMIKSKMTMRSVQAKRRTRFVQKLQKWTRRIAPVPMNLRKPILGPYAPLPMSNTGLQWSSGKTSVLALPLRARPSVCGEGHLSACPLEASATILDPALA